MALYAEAGCQAEVTRGRCAKHAAESDRRRRRRHRDIFRTKRWALTRRRKLSKNPICERCEEELATEVHHAQRLRRPVRAEWTRSAVFAAMAARRGGNRSADEQAPRQRAAGAVWTPRPCATQGGYPFGHKVSVRRQGQSIRYLATGK
jgi:hypothetical protein